MKRMWKAGVLLVVLLALGGVAAGIVAAQTGGTSTPTEQNATSTETSGATATPNAGATPESKKQQLVDDFLTKLAANLGIGVDQLKQAITTTDYQLIDQAVADGKITQDEADKIKERVASGQLFPFMRRGHGPGFGHERGFGHGPGMMFGMMLSENGDLIKQTADFLGITRQDVIDGLQNNQSLADIAEAHGKTADDLSGYVIDQLTSALDQAVKENRITQDRADQILAAAKDRIDNAINHGGLPGHGDWHGDNDGTPDDGTPSGSVNPTSL